ncbi:MAG: hypothetical protein ACUVUD_06385 [bacterium]
MKAIFWFLLLIVAVLFGLFIFKASRQRLTMVKPIVFEVAPDSIKAFEERVEKLEKDAAILRDRLGSSRLIERFFINRRIAILEQEIQDLKTMVAKLRTTIEGQSTADIYLKCLILYGKASGVCELLATDTLPQADRQR